MPVDKLTIQQFAQKIKDKYPDYKDVDDSLLTQKIIDKYPDYKDMVQYDIPKQSPTTGAPLPRFPHFVDPNEFIQPSEKQPVSTPDINPNAASLPTSQELHDKRVQDAERDIPKFLDTKEANKAIDELANSPFVKSGNQDNPNSFDVNMRPEDRQDYNKSKDIRDAFKSVIRGDSPTARKILEDAKSVSNNPDFNKKVESAFAASDYRNGDVGKNIKLYNDIQSGKLGYDLVQKRPTIALHPAEAFIQGLEDHYNSVQLADDLASKSKDEIIAQEENKLKEDDPYKPIPMSKGWASTITNTAGQTAVGFEKAALGTMIGASTGNAPMVGNALGTLFVSHDAGKQAAGQTFENSYRELREKGMAPTEAYDTALDQAKSSGVIAAGVMASMGYAGLKMGSEPLGGAVYGKGFKELLKSQLTNAKTFLKRAAPEVGVQGAIAGAGKALENINEGKPVGQDVLGAAAGAAAFVGLIGAVGAGAKSFTPKGKEVAMNGLAKTNPDLVEQAINQNVVQKNLTPEQADNLRLELSKQQALNKGLPETTPEGNKPKIQKLIQKRTELENQLNPDHPGFLDPAFHKDIKEQINGVKKEKADGKTEGKDGINEQIRQLTEQKETPNFHEEDLIKPPLNQAKDLIAEKLKKGQIADHFKDQATNNPESFLKDIADHAHGSVEFDGRTVSSKSGAEEEFGSDLVDLATKIYPEHNISSPKTEANGKTENAQAQTEGQIENQYAGQQTASSEKPHVTVSTPNIVNVKLKDHAISKQIAGEVGVRDGAAVRQEVGGANEPIQPSGEGVKPEENTKEGEIAGEKKPPVGPPSDELPFGKEETTGIKNVISNIHRSERVLPKVDVPKLGNDVEVLREGKELVDSGKIDPQRVVERINSTNEGMHPDEAKAMQYYMHQLAKHENNLTSALSETTNPVERADIGSHLQQLSDDIDAATSANIKSGTAWSHVGNIRQIIVDAGFNPSREKAILKSAYGGELPADVKSKLDAITKERDAAIDAKNKAEERLKNMAADKAVVKIKKEAEKSIKLKQTKEQLKQEEQELLKEIRKSIKKDLGNLHAGIPIPKETLETLGKLAVNYFKQGAITAEALVGRLYEQLKDDIEGLNKKDLRDFLAQYEPLSIVKETARVSKKAEGIENKITPTVLKTKHGKLEGVSEKPDFTPIVKVKLTFKKDPEWVKANQRLVNAEYKLKTLKRKAFESQKNMYQKALMWFSRLTRLSVLSGYNVLYKLSAAATIGGAGKRIPEQAFGAIYGGIFKGISEKAPIEGMPYLNSEVQFYKEFFNPKKFLSNSKEILKSGSSYLTKQFGNAEYEHIPGLYLPTDLHQIIKDPLKRGTFEASFRNGMHWAEKNNFDITDPLIVQSIENAAYKRANYEIFQEQSWLTKKFNDYKTKLDKSGNVGSTAKFLVDFMIPVSTVPTNIAKRLATTSPFGLIRGGVKVVEAYRKGIENLKPEEADAIMRQLKQGSLGTAMWLVGWFGYQSFGGLYSKFDPNKKRMEGDFKSDEMEVGGEMLPKPVQHALPLEIIQLAATARRIHDNYSKNKGANEFESTYNAALGSIGAVAEQIPIIETGVHAIEATGDPYQAQKLKQDARRRFEPQILRETGIIKPDAKASEKSKPGERQYIQKQYSK